MSLKKTRKRAIKKAIEREKKELFCGYTVEEINSAIKYLDRAIKAVAAGIVAFVNAFSESLRQ